MRPIVPFGNRTGATRWLALAALAALLILKLVYVFTLDVNSDEPQHLHVIWGWTAGQLPYRDFFDNHAPLFQMLWAPILALFGETDRIVGLMRLTVLPLYGWSLWLTWCIARRLWSPAIGAAAVAITAVFEPFFIVSTQFRPDDLWAPLWIATICALTSGRLDARRGLLAGLLAGATLAVSLKTLLLLATAAFAGFLVAAMLHLSQPGRQRVPWVFLATFVAGLLVIPALLAAFFVIGDAGPAMFYALFRHNVVHDLGRWEHGDLRFAIAPLTLPLVLWIAWKARPRGGDPSRWARQCFAVLAACGYLVALYGYWPLLTRQDWLPVAPFVGIGVAAVLLRAGAAGPAIGSARQALVVAVVAIELVALLAGHPPRAGHYAEFRQRLTMVLELSQPRDYVMDAKGEAIFRRRPVYWVLEGITLTRMREGSIADDIAARLAATSTPLVLMERLPDSDQGFVESNYLALADDVHVAGRHLGELAAGQPVRFAIVLRLEYAPITRSGPGFARIDGHACTPACALAPGVHTLVPERAGDFALIWAPALSRHIAPTAVFARVGAP